MGCNHFYENKFCKCTCHKLIVAEENKMKFILENKNAKEICKIKIDDGYIASSKVEKCDFLVLNCPDKVAFFIELKGHNLLKAISQIRERT
jgi:hypothetical protein